MSPVLVVPGQPWTCPGFAARFAVPRATRAGDGASPGRSRWCCLQRNPALLISLQNLTRLCCSTRACVCMCADKNLYRSCFPDSPSDWQQNKLPFPSPHTLSAADKTWARRRAADSTARKELPYPESCPDPATFLWPFFRLGRYLQHTGAEVRGVTGFAGDLQIVGGRTPWC